MAEPSLPNRHSTPPRHRGTLACRASVNPNTVGQKGRVCMPILWPIQANKRTEIPCFRPKFGEVRLTLVKFGPFIAQIGQFWAKSASPCWQNSRRLPLAAMLQQFRSSRSAACSAGCNLERGPGTLSGQPLCARHMFLRYVCGSRIGHPKQLGRLANVQAYGQGPQQHRGLSREAANATIPERCAVQPRKQVEGSMLLLAIGETGGGADQFLGLPHVTSCHPSGTQ